MSLVAVGYTTSDGFSHVLGWARYPSIGAQMVAALRQQGYNAWSIQTVYPEPARWADQWTEILGSYRGTWYLFGKYDYDWLPTIIDAMKGYFSPEVELGIENNPAMRNRDTRMAAGSDPTLDIPVVAYWKTA